MPRSWNDFPNRKRINVGNLDDVDTYFVFSVTFDRAQDEDAGDSNPPSLESVSSGSEHSSPSHSLEHPGLERIEKLEAMLDRIEATSSASPTLYRTASTQTLSTGDIVMTKVYADKT